VESFYTQTMAVDLKEVVWVVRALGEAFSLSGCAERLGTTTAALGYPTAHELLVATADDVIDTALALHPGETQSEVCAMLWAVGEKFCLAPRLGRTMSSLQWETAGGQRLTKRLGGQSIEVDLVLGLLTGWWEPFMDPHAVVADPTTGRPVNLRRLLAQDHLALGRYTAHRVADPDDELRLWSLYSAVEALLSSVPS
jgi:hypothetical protein